MVNQYIEWGEKKCVQDSAIISMHLNIYIFNIIVVAVKNYKFFDWLEVQKYGIY